MTSGSSRSEVAGKTVKILDRYIGREKGVEPEVFCFKPSVGDRILICTDGISSAIAAEEVFAIHGVNERCESFLSALSATAKTRGGKDNITGISIRVQ